MKTSRINILELLVVVLLSCAVVFGVTGLWGTLTSGWHFVDDHEFFEYSYLMKYENMSVWDVISKYLESDILSRNRFLYHPCRVLFLSFLGTNSLALSIEKAVETVLAMVILYFCGRELTGNKIVSFFFSLACLVGYQSALWWKLGPEHMQATICFGISFLCLLKWLKDTRKIIFEIASIIFAVVMSFFHESFILVIPFMGLYAVYDHIVKERDENGKLVLDNEDKSVHGLIRRFCGDRVWYVFVSLLICVGLLLSIVIRLGLNSYKPVGYEGEFSVSKYFETFAYTLKADMKWYWFLGVILFGILLTYYEKLKGLWLEAVLAVLFILPQFVLYSKEGIVERYLLPVVIGYFCFFVVFVYKARILTGKRKMAYISVLIAMLLLNSHGMIVEGDYYRFRGQSVTNALEEMERCADSGYKVMSCFGIANPEADWNVEYYLKSHGKEDVFYWNDGTCEVYTGRPYAYRDAKADGLTVSDMDVIFAYNRDDRHFEIEPSIDLSDYALVVSGSINIYYKNDIVGEIDQEVIDGLKVKPTIYGIGAEK